MRAHPTTAPHRFLAYMPFASIAWTITAAAKVELFTYLVCQAHQPVLNPDQGTPDEALAGVLARSVVAAAFSGERRCLPHGLCAVRRCAESVRAPQTRAHARARRTRTSPRASRSCR